MQMTRKPCGCQQEMEQIHLAITESDRSRWDRLDDIAIALKTLTGVCTRLLARVEEASGMPRGVAYTIVETTPAQSTLYDGGQIALNGVAQGLLVAGPGNVSIYLYNPQILGGKALIATVPCGGGTIFVPFRQRVTINDFFAIETDSSGATMLSLATYLTPIQLTGSQLYQIGI